MKKCEANDCDKILPRAKYCNMHKLRHLRHGNANFRTRVAKGEWKNVQCKVPGCDRDVNCMNLCKMHYQRDRRLEKIGLSR